MYPLDALLPAGVTVPTRDMNNVEGFAALRKQTTTLRRQGGSSTKTRQVLDRATSVLEWRIVLSDCTDRPIFTRLPQ
jgi:hypothetical protein